MFEAFTKVTKVRGLGRHCPARLNIVTGELQLNMDVWPRMTAAQKRDVVSHEEGHWLLQTYDENLADHYSLMKQNQQGYSLKEAVNSIADLLDPRNPEHVQRAWMRFGLAEKLDGQRNRHTHPTASYNGCNCHKNTNYGGYYSDSIYNDTNPLQTRDVFVNYGVLGICFSKKCREQKAVAKAAKLEAKNMSKVLLAAQGVKSGLGGVFQDLGQGLAGTVNLAKSVAPAIAAIASPGIGGGVAMTGDNVATQTLQNQQANAMTQALQPAQQDSTAQLMAMMQADKEKEQESKKKQQNLFIIIAVVVVVLILLIVLLKRGKQ